MVELCSLQGRFLYVGLGDEGIGRHRNYHPQQISGSLFAGVSGIDVDMKGGSKSKPIETHPEMQ